MSPVARELYSLHARIILVILTEDLPRLIAAAIVHEHELTIPFDLSAGSEAIQQGPQALECLGKDLFFVVARNHDRESGRTGLTHGNLARGAGSLLVHGRHSRS